MIAPCDIVSFSSDALSPRGGLLLVGDLLLRCP